MASAGCARWLAATCAAVAGDLSSGETSVGTQVTLTHRRPSAVGEEVTVTAEVTGRDGARVGFEVVATDSSGTEIARGEASRAVVERGRFLSRL